MALAPEQTRIGIRRHFTDAGTHPYDTVQWERRDARITNFRDGTVAFEQTDVEFPTTWSLNATNIVAQKYFRGTLGTAEREWSLRQVIDRVADTITALGRPGRLLRRRRRGRDLQRRAQVPARAPEGGLQQPGLVQHRGGGRAPAGQRLLHPVRRRQDGLDPQLVRRGGHDLQGRLGGGHQPVPHPLQPRAAEGRGHRQRPGELHAGRRRLRRDDQVRGQDPPRRQDGHPRRGPPRRRGVHLVQGP